MRASILQECHDTPLGGHFGRHRTAALVRRLAYWPGQTRDVDTDVGSCEVCQRTKADPVGPRGLLHPLPLPSRRGDVIEVDWLLGLPMTASGSEQAQVHVDHLSGKVHPVPTRATDTAADAASTRIVLEMTLCSGDGMLDVLVVDHDPKFTSALLKEFTPLGLPQEHLGSAYRKNTNAKAERATRGGPLSCGCGRRPQHIRADPPGVVQVQSHGQRRPAQALLLKGEMALLLRHGHRDRPGSGGGVVMEQLNRNLKPVRGRTCYRVRWQGHSSAADS